MGVFASCNCTALTMAYFLFWNILLRFLFQQAGDDMLCQLKARNGGNVGDGAHRAFPAVLHGEGRGNGVGGIQAPHLAEAGVFR